MFEFGDIRLRPIEREDLRILHEWENDFEVTMYSRNMPINFVNMYQLEKRYEEWVKDEREQHFIVEMVDSKEAIGIARLEREDWANVRSADVGTYIGKKELWGKGYGQQITVALLEIVFNQLNMDRCEASSVEYNVRAHKVLEACGLRKVGVARQSAFVNGRKWDRVRFDILREEYLKIRMELLKKTLNDKLGTYIEKHCTIRE
ncbi:GNAT family N-acetyltransferase [Candidatus Bathyarchaeota archaeon]|nr:GNAT family N-acetyltransferase [Candidatus Bathyarchaeota archaeon]